MKCTVIITEDVYGNVSATAPGLPDCHVQAKTRQDVIRKIGESIAEFVKRSEVLQLEIPAEPLSGSLQQETPWDLFGGHPHESEWGSFFEEVEQQRETNRA
jgi:predicted RNase H-like HicB family nuclease